MVCGAEGLNFFMPVACVDAMCGEAQTLLEQIHPSLGWISSSARGGINAGCCIDTACELAVSWDIASWARDRCILGL